MIHEPTRASLFRELALRYGRMPQYVVSFRDGTLVCHTGMTNTRTGLIRYATVEELHKSRAEAKKYGPPDTVVIWPDPETAAAFEIPTLDCEPKPSPPTTP